MKALLTKSQKEMQSKVFEVVQSLQKGGYIKGYGAQDRVMTEDHSPVRNIHRSITNCLKFNGLLIKTDLHLTPTEKIRSIKTHHEIDIDVSL